jgi:hypothetical protein
LLNYLIQNITGVLLAGKERGGLHEDRCFS